MRGKIAGWKDTNFSCAHGRDHCACGSGSGNSAHEGALTGLASGASDIGLRKTANPPTAMHFWRVQLSLALPPDSGPSRLAEDEPEDRAEKRQEDDDDNPDELVGGAALQAVNQSDDPHNQAEDRDEVVDIHVWECEVSVSRTSTACERR